MAARRLTVLALVVVALAGPAAALNGIIQPGERLQMDGGLCTMAFVFDGLQHLAGKVYVMTAAHCVDGIGQTVGTFGDTDIGKVAYRGDFNTSSLGPQTTGCCTEEDIAFIEINADDEVRVVPWVKGHPDMPRGVSAPGRTVDNRELVQLSGYGTGWTAHNATREQRVGVLRTDDAREYRCLCPATPGDSGGPVIVVGTGEALGLVSGIPLGATWTLDGPTVQHALYQTSVRGFPLALRTV